LYLLHRLSIIEIIHKATILLLVLLQILILLVLLPNILSQIIFSLVHEIKICKNVRLILSLIKNFHYLLTMFLPSYLSTVTRTDYWGIIDAVYCLKIFVRHIFNVHPFDVKLTFSFVLLPPLFFLFF